MNYHLLDYFCSKDTFLYVHFPHTEKLVIHLFSSSDATICVTMIYTVHWKLLLING